MSFVKCIFVFNTQIKVESLSVIPESFPGAPCQAILSHHHRSVLPVFVLDTHGVTQFVLSYVWPIALSITFRRIIHVAAHTLACFYCKAYSIICINHNLLHFAVGEHFGVFPVFWLKLTVLLVTF